jgi:GTP-binding protein EngB required for normal cell division
VGVFLDKDSIIVFTGRPNAGKSSVISYLTRLKLPVGKSPGTTTRFRRYKISKGLSIVDMPGYGRKKSGSKKWEELVKDRILEFIEENLGLIVLSLHVINISTFLEVERRLSKKGYLSLDIEMVDYVRKTIDEYPVIVANKIDKVGRIELENNLVAFYDGLKMWRTNLEDVVFPVSAKTGEGMGLLKRHVHNRLDKGFLRPFDYLR